jgi:hypothetical protein
VKEADACAFIRYSGFSCRARTPFLRVGERSEVSWGSLEWLPWVLCRTTLVTDKGPLGNGTLSLCLRVSKCEWLMVSLATALKLSWDSWLQISELGPWCSRAVRRDSGTECWCHSAAWAVRCGGAETAGEICTWWVPSPGLRSSCAHLGTDPSRLAHPMPSQQMQGQPLVGSFS